MTNSAKTKLFVILTEEFNGREWTPRPLEYAHAYDARQAEYGYRLTLGYRRNVRIAHCGEVIGYFAERHDSKIVTV